MGGEEGVARQHKHGKLTVRERIAGLVDPEAERKEIEQRLQAIASPFRSAEAYDIEDIIDPRDTRRLICDFIGLAQKALSPSLDRQQGQATVHERK